MKPTSQPLFINTRPSHRGRALACLPNVRTLSLPLLAIHDVPLDDADRGRMADLLAGKYQALIITSLESAKRAIAFLQAKNVQAQDLPPFAIIAVGSATAKAVREFGLSVILPATANNEGMLALDEIMRLHACDKVLIWRGKGGRRLLHDTLVMRGVDVQAIEWYERAAPADLADNFAKHQAQIRTAIANGAPVVALISSEQAFRHWQAVSGELASQVHYLALGARLVNIIQHALPSVSTHIHEIQDLQTASIACAINAICT
ncbi:hypothetical protein B0181_00745 [Moraxella caviae]|uniref:Uroporphyrinogen-III synthase n=1 Tax=Moraxella caviae TaxID=34060 RepID=A0A1T0ABW7_9GAMM|nr:uroporphyrinogen-III synthase [Moraxella caviae]OOR93203.1 hypothetical protein B0181_00745 [Moraxella caviae]STZ10476.1 uroporphyrinogen-III synthase [Moraxella caviae]VEW12800.1 uroporphyrinogen-III synthase [Moraxella caviae]